MAYTNNTGYPSVTEILKPFIDTEWFTQEHSDRGTAIHAACSAYIQNLFVPALPLEYQPYFDSFKRWADITIDDVVFCEERLVDEALGYCGQPDSVIKIRGNDGLVLPDWKTSQAVHKSWGPQTAAYSHLVVEAKGLVIERRLSVRLKNDGSGCLATEYSGATDWNVFRSALNCFKYFNGR